MAFKTSASSCASTSQESVVAAKELMFVLNTLNEKEKLKQHYNQHPDTLREELPKVAESQSGKHMELSQIELIYRAEGNANLVLALPQFKKVLRLPKIQIQQQQQQRQQEQEQQQKSLCQDQKQKQHQQVEERTPLQYGQQHEQQMYQQELKEILTTGQQQNENASVGILTMDHYVAYIGIIRCLVGNEYVFEADIVAVPNPNDRDWINKHIKPYRPANRLDKEFGGHLGLLLPDATRLPAEFDILFSNEQHNITTASKTSDSSGGSANNIVFTCSTNNLFGTDTYAIEIKPKQGWLLPNDVNNLFDIKAKETITTKTSTTMSINETRTTSKAAVAATTDMPCFTMSTQNKPLQINTTTAIATTSKDDKPTHTSHSHDNIDTRCRYCCMQFLKVKQQKIKERSKYCPLDLFSGNKDRMFYALQTLFECPQNNFRIFKNGQLIFDDKSSETHKIEQLFSSDKLQILKHLLVTCLLREYDNKRQEMYEYDERKQLTMSRSTPITDTVGVSRRYKVADSDDSVSGVAAGQPQSSVTSCSKKQKFNTIPTETMEIMETTSARDTATCTSSMRAITETEVTKVKSTLTSAEPILKTSTFSTNTLSYDNILCLEQITKPEVTCLPRNCVLQKILNLQLLAKINLQFMLDHEYHNKRVKSYSIVRKLLEKFIENHNKLTFGQLTPEEQYILAATALDCSIMITFCEIENVQEKREKNQIKSLIDNQFVVHLCGKTFLTKVTLLDLDPKPDTHFNKYCQQTKQIIEVLKTL